jgi:hypothetical protein
MKRVLFSAVLMCVALVPVHACAWNHSEIRWLTISTEHFNVQYHPGLERYASQAAEVAESVYGPITELYGYKPDGKVYLNFSDTEDESQGSTYYYLNRIDITATPLDFAFRGSSAWLSDVIAHEFTHMVSVQSSFKFPRWMPSLYFQAVNFEREKRLDVITGYPNVMVSVPIPGELLPNWFAEGMAQYQCRAARHDIWDSHRDMLLRSAYVGGRLLTLGEMGVFGKDSRGSEMVYNQGFSLVRFIASRFGDEKLRELASVFSSLRSWGFGGPCKRILGLSDDELYRVWKVDLAERYDPVVARVKEREIEGTRETVKGFMNICPVARRDKGGFFYLSNAGHDYMHLDIIYRAPDGKEKRLVSGAGSQFDISPLGAALCFTRRTQENEHQYLRNDIYRYDLAGKKEKRLTRGLRATNPEWSPDGKRIACVITGEGSQRVAIIDPESGSHVFVTPPVSGREYYRLSWGSNGILASRFEGMSRDIVVIDPATGSETVLNGTPADERDPSWDENGSGYFYAGDRTGIFNIYYHSMGDTSDLMVTNCIGGAFCPKADGAGLLFSGYGAEGFEIRSLENWRATAAPVEARKDDERLFAERQSIAGGRESPGTGIPEGNGRASGLLDAKREKPAEAKRFGIEYTKLFLYPRIMVYENKLRLGVFLDSGDYLGRQSVFAGASMNADGDFDLSLSAETRQFKPTLGFEVYRSRKFYSVYQPEIEPGINGEYVIRYDLWDAFFTCKMELRPTSAFSRNEAVLQFNHGEYGLNVEVWEYRDQKEFKGEGGWNYYLANEVSLLFHYMNIREEVDADVNPRSGRALDVELTQAFDKLHSGEFEFMFRPAYNKDYFGRYMLTYEEHVPLPFLQHAVSLWLKGGAIDRSNIDDFFYLYLGGLDGLRGYSYFSMGGTKLALGRLTYRFPLWRNVNRQVGALYLGSFYAAAFAEAGKAWNESTFDLNGNKKDVGFEFRLKGFSFYSYPIAASFQGAYGLNDVVYRDPFNTFAVFYGGHSWRYYGSILFSF